MTYRATLQFLDHLQSFGDVRSEIVFLSEYDVGLRRGCKACFIRGESSARSTTTGTCSFFSGRRVPIR